MQFYQVHYGGGEWEDSWEQVSGIYTTKEKADEHIKQLGFKWTVHSSGYEEWEQQEEYDSLSYTPYWARVESVRVVE